jgi:hypothetical protein
MSEATTLRRGMSLGDALIVLAITTLVAVLGELVGLKTSVAEMRGEMRAIEHRFDSIDAKLDALVQHR